MIVGTAVPTTKENTKKQKQKEGAALKIALLLDETCPGGSWTSW